MCVCFAGCSASDDASFSNSNFEVIACEEDCGSGYVIMYHKETKVMYLFVKHGYGAGLTVMLDENGKPLLYNGD